MGAWVLTFVNIRPILPVVPTLLLLIAGWSMVRRDDDGRETDCDGGSCVVAGQTGLTPVQSTCPQHP